MNPDQPSSMHAPVGLRGPVFVTVHGTWAGKARWTKPDSLLGRALLDSARERGECATVEPFIWSGKNSIAARRAAGAVLGRRLQELRRQDPSRPIYVIAHSHGGSVFAYALREEADLADRVDGFIALATPWIAVQSSGYAVALRSLLLNAVLYLLLLPSLIGAGRIAEWLFDYWISLRSASQDSSIEALGQGLADVFSDIATFALWYVLMGVVAGIVGYTLNRRLAHWLASSASEFEHQTKVAADQAGTLRHERLPPSVFFKPVGDEAALTLVWTSAMATLMQASSQLLFRVLQSIRDYWLSISRRARIIGSAALIVAWFVGTAVLAVFTLLADGPTTAAKLANAIRETFPPGFHLGHFDVAHLLWDLPAVFAFVMWAGLILALVALASVTLVAWLAAAGAGIPTLRAALFMRIAVEATPLGDHQLVLVDVSGPKPEGRVAAEALSHSSLYESPNVIAAVLTAIHRFPERTVRQTDAV